MNTPKTLAKIGSVYIEEAILAILEDAEGNLLPQEISERLGIPTDTDGILRLANAIVLGFLTKLKLEGRVQDTDERPNVPRRWSLRDAPLDSDEDLLTDDNTQNALETLKQSVLQVLYEGTDVVYEKSRYPQGYADGRILKAGEIREKLNILQPQLVCASTNALIHGILDHLRDDGHAYHYVSQGWAITEKGISVIEDS